MNDISDGIFAKPLTFPIYQTSSYVVPGGEKYRYSREYNPTVENVGLKIKAMEHAEAYNAFSSGMGAITTTVLSLIHPGDRALIHLDTFARSYHFFTEYLRSWGVKIDVADPGTDNIIKSIKNDTKLVFIESLSNPILRVNDIKAISEKCRETGSLLIVDATFSTPVNIHPLDLGADIVIHSASKFISGHNDAIAGFAAGREDLIEKIDNMRRTLGTSMDPNTAFLVNQGIKTLELRMERINKNANIIAHELQDSGNVKNVIYPGLDNHPDHEIALKYMNGFSGVVDFEIQGDVEKFFKNLKNVVPANTLGGINTIISNPFTMSHRSLNESELKILNVNKKFMRLSVGIENPDIIIKDLLNAASATD
ncbi:MULTISPECIES: aminotransferase class V-fold PLP-dependent enzyme [Acidiplasma]|uniref:Cystathionine gamma-synthase n=2 Tax=Acidiplasma TaxID=507753 RepID=A0A0Q0RQG7_9ARCH|nr:MULTISPECIES: aminotransferase class V-fold PLP-dependent enzyme [Acidiplasma]KQB34506.1 hypothetical protein AOG55_00100 [Acidiplasma cupricumulans]KQB36431.1 hypothetical protein AOG54_07415 [Acidiplasma aeolicum]WMT54373.1 MAG: aminotransferase class V-fold PLP-dependent enzyme [Acidiplasma sp.]